MAQSQHEGRLRGRAYLATAAGAAFVVLVAVYLMGGGAGRDWPVSVLLAACLSWLVAYDIRDFRLPNGLTLPLLLAGLAHAGYRDFDALWLHGAGAGAGYGVIAGLAFAFRRRTGRDGIGLGDAKLLAACGAWLGLAPLPFLLLAASGGGLIFAGGRLVWRSVKRTQPGDARIPFGPFIVGGFWICWTWPDIWIDVLELLTKF